MKLRKELVHYLSEQLVKSLEEKELIDSGGDVEGVAESVTAVIVDDLLVEDELNTEVKEMLEQVGEEMDKSNVNYHRMFQMVKQKLVRERGLIL